MSYRQSLWFYGGLLVILRREGCVLMEKMWERELIVMKSKTHIFSFFWSLNDYQESKTILFPNEGKFATLVCLKGRLMGLEIFLKISLIFCIHFSLMCEIQRYYEWFQLVLEDNLLRIFSVKILNFLTILRSVFTIRVYFVFSVPCQKCVFDNLGL
jgi:hypothetical protein